jgi:hypothetical protein
VAELLARLRGASAAQANLAGDLAEAYGPALAYFLLMLAGTILLSRALRKPQDPYSLRRQRLGVGGPLGAE